MKTNTETEILSTLHWKVIKTYHAQLIFVRYPTHGVDVFFSRWGTILHQSTLNVYKKLHIMYVLMNSGAKRSHNDVIIDVVEFHPCSENLDPKRSD